MDLPLEGEKGKAPQATFQLAHGWLSKRRQPRTRPVTRPSWAGFTVAGPEMKLFGWGCHLHAKRKTQHVMMHSLKFWSRTRIILSGESCTCFNWFLLLSTSRCSRMIPISMGSPNAGHGQVLRLKSLSDSLMLESSVKFRSL